MTRDSSHLYLSILAMLLCWSPTGCKEGSPEDGDTTPLEDAGSMLDANALSDAAPSMSDADADADASAELCPAERLVADGCMELANGSEGASDLCDGYDNDCDGYVDEGCPCAAGSVQECFAGPPGRARTGACQFGMQVCNGDSEFGGWGECERGISPQAEVCDRLDNDCNGCVDDREDCPVYIECPGENDPRLPKVKPFEVTTLDAAMFYNGNDVASTVWSLKGSPCDELYASIPGFKANSTLSYKLENARSQQAKVSFTLSGTYLVTLTITLKSGQVLSCTFPIVVGAGGLRVELCWDKTGPTAGGQFVDLDLHLALKNRTSAFFQTTGSGRDFYTVTFGQQNFNVANGIWGHAPTPDVTGCLTGNLPGSADQIHMLRNNCVNPRLDLDNQGNTSTSRYLPENINLDNPRAGEIFQVAVDHVSQKAVRVKALVNVYCGGKLRGSYAIDPTKTAFSDDADAQQELWRVVEIAPSVNAQGVTTDCALTPLHPPDASGDNLVTVGETSIDWSK